LLLIKKYNKNNLALYARRSRGESLCSPLHTGQAQGPAPASQLGFTLLEVMVAVAIIAITFVSLLGSQSQSISIAEISRFETNAAMLAREKLTELQLEGFDALSNDSGRFEDDFSDFYWQAEVRELGEDDTGIAGTDSLLKLVTLNVNRGEDENQVFTLRSVIMADIEPAEEE
jgi:general secretion pathway protein I